MKRNRSEKRLEKVGFTKRYRTAKIKVPVRFTVLLTLFLAIRVKVFISILRVQDSVRFQIHLGFELRFGSIIAFAKIPVEWAISILRTINENPQR